MTLLERDNQFTPYRLSNPKMFSTKHICIGLMINGLSTIIKKKIFMGLRRGGNGSVGIGGRRMWHVDVVDILLKYEMLKVLTWLTSLGN